MAGSSSKTIYLNFIEDARINEMSVVSYKMFFYILKFCELYSAVMISVLLAAVLLYLLQMIVLRIGLERADRARRLEEYEPTVSVIVAARNEEHCIQQCIDSLLKLEYPREKLEITIVNDGSTDRTREIAEMSTDNSAALKVISAMQGEGNLRGKANAISQGIDASSGEILMFTDADCTVPERWVKETVRYFDNGVGVVGGFTLLNA